MGRMRKQTADFFPHFTYKGRTLTVLESKWGCEGYTFWFKLLELLCVSDGHCYDCSKPTNMSYLAITAMVSEETALKILNLLADMGKIDAELWNREKRIWCQSLVDRLSPLYAKRTTTVPKKPVTNEAVQETSPEPPEQPSLPKNKTEKKDVEKKEKPPKSTAAKPPEPEKIQYAEFVSMTAAEYQKLIDKYGAERTALFIKKLDNAKGAKGYKYKSDYRAILNWVVGEVEKELQKKGGNTNGRPYPDRNDAEQPSAFTPSGGFRGSGT